MVKVMWVYNMAYTPFEALNPSQENKQPAFTFQLCPVVALFFWRLGLLFCYKM